MKPLRIIVSAYMIFLFVAWLIDSTALWGAYHLAYLPPGLVIFLLLAGFSVLWMPDRAYGAAVSALSTHLNRIPRAAILITGAVCAALLFVLARSRNHLLGDGHTVMANLENQDVLPSTETLDVLIHRLVYQLLNDSHLSYLLLSIVSGFLFLVVVGLFARKLSDVGIHRIGVVLMFVGLAQVQFFFGYAENYTMMAAFLSLFVYLGWRYTLGEGGFWWAVSAFVVMGAFHLSGCFALPGLVYLFWLKGRRDRKLAYRLMSVLTVVCALLVATWYYLEFQGEQIFVPLAANELNPYSLLSYWHLLDIANTFLLVSPLPLCVLACSVPGFRRIQSINRHQLSFLLLCSAGTLFFTLAIDPKIGAARDWDLLSIYGIPLSFVAAYVSAHVWRAYARKAVLAGACLAVILTHTVPWVISNTSSQPAMEKIKKIIASDIHYTPGYYRGYRLTSWGFLVGAVYNDLAEKERSFRLRVQGSPDDQRAWLVYAVTSNAQGKRSQAHRALQQVKDLDRLYDSQLKELASLQLEFEEFSDAKRTAEYALQYRPDNFDLLLSAGVALHGLGSDAKASQYFRKAMDLDSSDIQLLINYAASSLALDNLELTVDLIDRAGRLPDITDEENEIIAVLKSILIDKKHNAP